MSNSVEARRQVFKAVLAVVGTFAAGGLAQAKITSDPMVREMEARARKARLEHKNGMLASLCKEASCNPGCQDGCQSSCQASCTSGKK